MKRRYYYFHPESDCVFHDTSTNHSPVEVEVITRNEYRILKREIRRREWHNVPPTTHSSHIHWPVGMKAYHWGKQWK